MPLPHKLKEKTRPDALIALLNRLLAGAIDLKLSAKQAHWNVTGETFIALHGLFDTVSAEADGYADLLAERAVQLGGTAQGTLQAVAAQPGFSSYPTTIRAGQDHVQALSGVIDALADTHRQAITTANDANDMVSADLLTEIARGLDKLHWLVRSHISG